jgi:hypothetical protein
MAISYYIYYRVRPEETERARALVATVQLSLQADTGIRGRLLRRGDDACTWMEIYESVADAVRFEAALDGLIAQSGLAACLAPDARRHVERFVPL